MTKSEHHVKAANERWNPTIPRATHSGILNIGGIEIACDVLEDETRVLRRKEFLKTLGRGKPNHATILRAERENLPIFLSAKNLSPYFEGDFLARTKEISYKNKLGIKYKGYNSNILPETCEIYLKARQDKVLTEDQLHIAQFCEIMMRAFAKVGLVALIDECTGYQEVRQRNELEKILEKYISEELRSWTKKFPNEFFKQVYRLYGWEYSGSPRHPKFLGSIINKYVYEKLPPGVLEELKRKNPRNENGHRQYRHHQFLSEDIGEENLLKQIVQTTSIMKVSDSINEFKKLMDRLS